MNTELEQLLEKIANLNVLVIGEAILDCYLEGFSDRLCPEAPVPVVNITGRKYTPGGAANTAVNVHSLGAKVKFLSVIGNDWEGNLLQQVLQQQGVPSKYVLQHFNRQTLTKQRVMAMSQMLVRFDQGSTTAITPQIEAELIAELERCFPEANAVIVSDYGYGILTPGVIQSLARLQQNQPRILVVDAKDLTTYRNLGVTAVKPNYEQAIQLLNLPKLTAGARVAQIAAQQQALLELTGAEIVAVTLDTEGGLIFTNEQSPYRTHTQAASPNHTSGAGDTFVSALTLALAAGASTQTAADFAAAAAGSVVVKAGTTTCSVADISNQLLSPLHKYLADSNQLSERVASYRATGLCIVFTNGCFDILHPGHVFYLQSAKALGDILIIGVNSDDSIRRIKGSNRPINTLADRIQVLSGLGCVDHLVAFDEDTPSNLIQSIRPDIYVKGGDYTIETLPEAALVEQLGGVVKILPFMENRSTSSIIARIADRNK